MNQLIALIQKLIASKHTSTAALVYFGLAVAGIIWPDYDEKLAAIRQAALTYGLFAAGDANAKPPSTSPPNPS